MSTTFKNLNKLHKLDLSHNPLLSIDGGMIFDKPTIFLGLRVLNLAGTWLFSPNKRFHFGRLPCTENREQFKLCLSRAPDFIYYFVYTFNCLSDNYKTESCAILGIDDEMLCKYNISISTNTIAVVEPVGNSTGRVLDLNCDGNSLRVRDPENYIHGSWRLALTTSVEPPTELTYLEWLRTDAYLRVGIFVILTILAAVALVLYYGRWVYMEIHTLWIHSQNGRRADVCKRVHSQPTPISVIHRSLQQTDDAASTGRSFNYDDCWIDDDELVSSATAGGFALVNDNFKYSDFITVPQYDDADDEDDNDVNNTKFIVKQPFVDVLLPQTTMVDPTPPQNVCV